MMIKKYTKIGPVIRNLFHDDGIHIHESFSAIIDGKEIKFKKNDQLDAALSAIPLVIFGSIRVLLNGLDRIDKKTMM